MNSNARALWAALSALTAIINLGCTVGASNDGTGGTAEVSSGLAADNPVDTGISLTASALRFAPFGNCSNIGCEGFAPPSASRPPKRTRGSNSQARLPNNMFFGDVDGDRQADVLQYDNSGRFFAYRGDFLRTEIHHIFMHEAISQVIVGDFYGAGWDQVCFVTSLDIHCYGIDATQDDQFRLFFKQPNPVRSSEDVIVGDYDGDGHDQLFLYDRIAGTFRMLVYQAGAGFVVSPSWTKSNLSRVEVPGIQFRNGDWTGDGRTDLVAKNAAGQVLAFAAATTASGRDTFFWAFDSVGSFIKSDDTFSLARGNDDDSDDLLIQNTTTGAINFYNVEYNNGRPPNLNVYLGQVPVTPNSLLAMTWSHPMRNEPGVENRDDPFLFTNGGSYIRTHEARWDAERSRFTYWLEYQSGAPNNNTGWPTSVNTRALFLKCKLAGDASTPRATVIDGMVSRIRDYYHEVTYKRISMSEPTLPPVGWVQMTQTYQQLKNMATAENLSHREVIPRECAKAAGKNPNDWALVVAFVNSTVDWGSPAYGNKFVLIGGNNNGDVYDVWATVHEIGHAFNLYHTGSNDPRDSSYANPWDPMSARTTGWTYVNALGGNEGPEFTAGNRDFLGALPSKRILEVPLGSAKRTVRIAALNRPATSQYLLVRLLSGDANQYYSLEYREPSGFDSALAHPTVLIHRVTIDSRRVFLYADQDGAFAHWGSAERRAGESYTVSNVATVRIVSIDPALHLAEVEITPNP